MIYALIPFRSFHIRPAGMAALPWKMMKNILWSTSQPAVPSGACQHIRVPFTVLGNGPSRRLQPSSQHQQLEQEQKQQQPQQHLSQTETVLSAEVVSDIALPSNLLMRMLIPVRFRVVLSFTCLTRRTLYTYQPCAAAKCGGLKRINN